MYKNRINKCIAEYNEVNSEKKRFEIILITNEDRNSINLWSVYV